MNKAFVREQDESVRHCPMCGSLGQRVTRPTLDHWLVAEARNQIGDQALFCPFPTCDVAYFDAFERFVKTDSLAHPAWPKNPDAPMCGCFGLTCADIEADVDEGGVTRLREHNVKARSSAARCSVLSASGQSCVAEVQRYFFKLRGGI